MSDDLDDIRLTAGTHDRAQALMELGRYQQAIPLLAKSLARAPDDAILHCRLADAHFYLGDHENSQQFAQRALHLDPNSDHAHFRLAWLRLNSKEFDTALQHARAASAIDPDDPVNLYTLAWAEYHSGHHNQALSAAQRAIELNPTNADLHELIADLLFNTGKKKQAQAHYFEALRHDPENASVHCHLGQCLAAQHKVHQASEHIFTAVKLEPDNEYFRETLFNIIHHDLLDIQSTSRDAALAKLDPAVQHFYRDQLGRRGWFEKLRVTSVATLWILIFLLLSLFFTWITGDDIASLSMLVIVVAGIYAMMFLLPLIPTVVAWLHKRKGRRGRDEA